jgi:hypothetical protein
MPRLHAAEPNWPDPEEPVQQPPQPELPPKKPSEPELPSPDPGRAPFPGPGPTDPGVPPPVAYYSGRVDGCAVVKQNRTRNRWRQCLSLTIGSAYSFGGSIPNAVANAI